MGLREQKEEQTRLNILNTAFQLFSRNGIDATTLVDIAAQCQLSRQTIYKYFDSKHALVQMVYLQNFQKITPPITEISPDKSIGQILDLIYDHFNSLLINNPEVLLFDAQYNLYAALIHQDPTQYPQHLINSPEIQKIIELFSVKYGKELKTFGAEINNITILFLTYFEHIQRMAIFWIQRGKKDKERLQNEFDEYNDFMIQLMMKILLKK